MDTQIKVGLLITNKEELLLIKEWSNNKNGYFWNVVKGSFEPEKDKTLAECAIREADEEIGVKITLEKFINLVIKHGFSTRIYVNLVASITNGEPRVASDENQKLLKEDIKEVKWLKKDDLKKMPEEEFINDVVFMAISKWLSGETYPLELLTEVDLNK